MENFSPDDDLAQASGSATPFGTPGGDDFGPLYNLLYEIRRTFATSTQEMEDLLYTSPRELSVLADGGVRSELSPFLSLSRDGNDASILTITQEKAGFIEWGRSCPASALVGYLYATKELFVCTIYSRILYPDPRM